MKRFALICLGICLEIPLFAGDPPVVRICGVKPNQGQVYLAVYASHQAFMKPDSAVYREILPATGDTVSFAITTLPEGDYALSVFHDLNSNRNLDVNALGIPVEAFGFSNNPRSFFGPPTFEQARVSLGEGAVVTIDLMSLLSKEEPAPEQKKMTKKEIRREKRKQRRHE